MTAEHFPVEATHILMFARSIGDQNPIYHDAEQAAATEVGHIIAPPTFVQAGAQFDPDYWLRPKPGEKWFGSGATPTGTPPAAETANQGDGDGDTGGSRRSGGGLHAEQHFEYHRHLTPGDVLTATVKQGESWQKQSRRGGTLTFSERITEYRDQDGELVITARSVGVQTEKPVEQDGASS
ncbi:MAG: MaoC family dehydratase N-terminal domain-containing protein [Actinomycetota bacterium]